MRISESPARPVELAGEDSGSPSRTTVQRLLGWFESENWIRKFESQYQITSNGSRVLDAYDDFVAVIEQLMDKAQLFQRLDPEFADIPVRELGDATLYFSSPEIPGVFLATALDLSNPKLERFRVLTPVFNETLFEAYAQIYETGVEGESIVDAALYNQLVEAGFEHFLDDSEYPGFRFYRLEESVTLRIAIYDESHVAIGGYNEVGGGTHIAMIVSSNDSLVDWCTELFESLLDQAELIFFRAAG
jgi:predicted transcriptional regulator